MLFWWEHQEVCAVLEQVGLFLLLGKREHWVVFQVYLRQKEAKVCSDYSFDKLLTLETESENL